MAETSPRNPRSIAEKVGEVSGRGAADYCGQCGLPGKDCLCSSFKPTGVEDNTRPGPGPTQYNPAKLGGG